MSLLTNPYWVYPVATGGGTKSIVQSSTPLTLTTGAQTLVVSLSNVTAGNALVLTFAQYSPNANDNPVAKDGTTTLPIYYAFTPGGNYSVAGVAYETNVAAGTHTLTIQAKSGSTAIYACAQLHEIKGITSATPTVQVSGTTTGATLTLAGGTPPQSGDLIFTVIADDGNGSGSTATATTPSGYTSLWQELNGSSYQIGAAAYQIQTTAAPVAPSWTGLNAAGGAGFAAVALAFN